jgi:hypothetical protein
MRIGAVIHPTAVAGSDRGPQLKRFLRHVIEMAVAMMLGMAVLGMTFRAIHLACSGPASTLRGTSTRNSRCSR